MDRFARGWGEDWVVTYGVPGQFQCPRLEFPSLSASVRECNCSNEAGKGSSSSSSDSGKVACPRGPGRTPLCQTREGLTHSTETSTGYAVPALGRGFFFHCWIDFGQHCIVRGQHCIVRYR